MHTASKQRWNSLSDGVDSIMSMHSCKIAVEIAGARQGISSVHADSDGGRAEPSNSGRDGLANGVNANASIANGATANGTHANGSLTAADDQKHSAADFDAEALPLSSFILNGQDYSKERSLKVGTVSPSMRACCAAFASCI